MSYELHHGDCIEVMRNMAAESVDAIVTSPPYAEQRKSTYGGIPEKGYPTWTVAWMAEVRRLLKPDGSVIINISPHIKAGQLANYVLRTRLALQEAGWNECDELIWHKTNPMPMGPMTRPRRSWESLLWYSTHGRPYSDPKANGKPPTGPTKVWVSGQHVNNDRFTHYTEGGKSGSTPSISRCQNVVAMGMDTKATGHPASYPWRLAEWCGKLICPPGGTVLDPFSGSASTGVAAIKNGWHYIGIDAVPEYIDMSHARLTKVAQEIAGPETLDLGEAA